MKLEGDPPVKDSCGCDGSFDDGCYNCNSRQWACHICGWPVARVLGGKVCIKCNDLDLTQAQVRGVMFAGRIPEVKEEEGA